MIFFLKKCVSFIGIIVAFYSYSSNANGIVGKGFVCESSKYLFADSPYGYYILDNTHYKLWEHSFNILYRLRNLKKRPFLRKKLGISDNDFERILDGEYSSKSKLDYKKFKLERIYDVVSQIERGKFKFIEFTKKLKYQLRPEIAKFSTRVIDNVYKDFFTTYRDGSINRFTLKSGQNLHICKLSKNKEQFINDLKGANENFKKLILEDLEKKAAELIIEIVRLEDRLKSRKF